MAHAVLQSSSLSCSSSMDRSRTSAKASDIFGSQLRSPEIEQTHLRFLDSFKRNPTIRLKALRESPGLAQEIIDDKAKIAENTTKGFLRPSTQDSRVCPSSILGFQPGEAFVVRNVANLVPPHENGPSETNAALEFAVNSLEVENILVGHSCCGGIKALMSLQDDADSRFVASLEAGDYRKASQESINRSLLNLLTYPWIEERVIRGKLSIHGGYYDFIDCTFEKWTLDYKGSGLLSSAEYSIKNREFWA
ncbi:Beta carbonic anhydrase 5, chloroplastic [Sesamum angolense]|uniref:Carbonic anhydrase n=1 Tax=Sesamum angolense TaxID=2727404 RepID=A0AAE1WY90_9LAMI|nr:Beta carbonic anhydrase 5, chloroplastic [Sesamum angolense]